MAGFEVLAINENCRAVCAKTDSANRRLIRTENEGISDLITNYLVECESFYKKYSRIRKAKILLPLAYVYKRLFAKKMDDYVKTKAKVLNN